MKKFGMWLALLVVLLALAAAPLASRLVQVRSSWQKKTAETKSKVLELRKKAVEAERALDFAQNELQRTIHDWERVWTGQVGAGRQAGTLEVLDLGANQGFAPAGNVIPIVYAFQPAADGNGMSYVGSFKISAAQETRSALTPNWRLRPDEDKTWRYGPNWRFRANIPLQYRVKFSDFEKTMLLKDESVAQQQRNLEYQLNAKTKAEDHLGLRLKELNGDPDRANQNLDKYLIAGFHKAVADLEVDRNRAQAEVDELRRQVKRARDEIERLTQENERLADERSSDVPQTATNKK